MKKLLVILFALGLVFAFSAPVMATDIDVSGTYYIRGWYDSNSPLLKDNAVSSAFYDQRFRLQGVFQVAEGLSVTVRGDVLDGTWGTSAMRGWGATTPGGVAGNTNNVQFDYAYATFMTALGQVKAGYMADGAWGTTFGDSWTVAGTIQFQTKLGEDIAFLLKTTKDAENDYNNTAFSDRDDDAYVAALVYLGEGINGGLLYKYVRDANDPAGVAWAGVESLQTLNALVPYVKLTMGDLYIESEMMWIDGMLPVTYYCFHQPKN